MPIVSISISDKLLEKFDEALAEKGFSGRSETLRDLIRSFVSEEEYKSGSGGDSIAVVSVLYGTGSCKDAVSEVAHKAEGIIKTTLHTHIDGVNCLEVFIAKGSGKKIDALVKDIKGVKGVKQVKCMSTMSGL